MNIFTKAATVFSVLLLSGGSIGLNLAEERTVTGTVIDTKCVPNVMRADDPEFAAGETHDMDCTLSEAGRKSGYTLIMGNKKLAIAKESTETVYKFLAAKGSNPRVSLTGTDAAGGFVVKSVKSAATPK